jgi:two-component system, NtrC family, sensor kinase
MKKTLILSVLLMAFLTAGAQHKKIDTLRVALNKATTDTDKYSAMYELGRIYYISYPDSSIIFYQQAFLIAKKYNWIKEQGNDFNGIANAYGSLGDYVNAVQYYLKALKNYQLVNYGMGTAKVDNNLGSTYLQKEDFKAGLFYLQKAIKPLDDYTRSHKLIGNEKNLNGILLLNLGECYLDLKKLDSAKYYLDISLKTINTTHYQALLGSVKRDLGEVQKLKGDKNGALQNFRQAVISDRALDDVENLSVAYLSMADLYHKYKLQDSAIFYAQKALDTAAAGNYEQDVLNAGKALYVYYDEDHNVAQAYKYFKITTAAKDSLYSQDKEKQLLTLDFNEKERLQELQAEQDKAQGRLRTYILSGGLAVLLLLSIIFWRNGKHRQKANKLLKKQKEDIETAMARIKLTQTQLIQSEKMASLGELTAGIAHEIQNPLNFVNNFSEVNKELLVEMKEEIDKGNLEEIRAIANNLIDNELKINHHGKRADFIVKGMLQHSRTNTGEKQLTNINVLADEFLKLSYHGLRAKDKSFNAELVTNFDENLPKVNIAQQDIGRVLLNLFNNSFYAVNQKQKTAGADYKPEVTVSTSAEKNNLIISVKDNGNGIPDAIKDKIMQPFFTTKPTGEGTGLGLSLSYDIVVKGHGGKISVKSVEGEGSEFIITIPTI